MKRNDSFDLKTLGILVLTILFFIIVAQNTPVVSFNLLWWKISMSRIVIVIFMLAMFVLGFLLGRHWRK